jgi:hypothetical protein
MNITNAARPTYVGIGAQKCASTWLHSILAEHPEVAVPEIKEVDFFSYRYDHGYQWYERCFRSNKLARARGEISPSYFGETAVPARVARYLPEAKILLSLRDPVERALSNHRHEVRVGHVTGPDFSFETGLENNPMYIEQGLYATHLGNWLRHFPSANILVILTDEIDADPRAVCRTAYRFLGIDESYVPSGLTARYNPSFATRWAPLGVAKDAVYRATRMPGLRWLWDTAARAGLRSVYRGINNVPSDAVIPPPLAQTLRDLQARFTPEVQELERMIGRSLATWLRQ